MNIVNNPQISTTDLEQQMYGSMTACEMVDVPADVLSEYLMSFEVLEIAKRVTSLYADTETVGTLIGPCTDFDVDFWMGLSDSFALWAGITLHL